MQAKREHYLHRLPIIIMEIVVTKKTPNEIIEDGVVELYRGFFKLRKENNIQEEYDTMGTIIDMLTKDRQYIRKTFKDKVKI